MTKSPVETVSGGPEVVPNKQVTSRPNWPEIPAKCERQLQGHILTGPVAVAGAEPGDVLEVDILDVQLRQDWGWNLIRPLAGPLPTIFTKRGS